MFLTLEKFNRRVQELSQKRYLDLHSIAPFSSLPGQEDKDSVNCRPPQEIDGPPVKIGDYFTGNDRYLWIEKNIDVPPAREGYETVGLFDFGGGGCNQGFESLLYINGSPYQGVDANHGDVLLTPLSGQRIRMTFLLWTGIGGGGPRRDLYHRIAQADVGYLHKPTNELYYLCRAIAKTLELLDESAPEYTVLMQAMDAALEELDFDSDRLLSTVPQALKTLKAGLGEKSSTITVHTVGHTHIDVAWLWRYKHTREKAIRSFATVLRLMEEYPEYIFLQTQPQLYRFLKHDCPEEFERIRARIREGRWEADGGMWLEADCNLPSGESLVRQFIHGISFFKKEFGVRAQYLWLPDVFGYSWALPQIMVQCGLSTFMTTKISWNQYNTIPNDLFRWRGIDGTEILSYFIDVPNENDSFDKRGSTYNGRITPHSVIGAWKKFKNKDLSQDVLISYGYGDGGGGVNRDMLEMRRALDSLPGVPNVKTSRAGDFFERIHRKAESAKKPPAVWDGELYLEYHRGTYTSQARNKRMNRKLEFALMRAEWLSSLSLLSGGGYEQERLYESWEMLLLNQFHDVIPGSSIHEVYEDSQAIYKKIQLELQDICAQAAGSLITPQENAFTILRCGSFPQSEPVLLPIKGSGSFTGMQGERLPVQETRDGMLVLLPPDALCLQTVRFSPEPAEKTGSPFLADLSAGMVKTPFYTVQFDDSGSISSLYDVENCREILTGPGNVWEIYEDKPINYDAWDIDLFHIQKSERIPMGRPELVENGAICLTLRFIFRWRCSAFRQDIRFYAHTRRIDFITHADWQEDHRLLKAAFPVDIRSTRATYDIQFGHVERPAHWNTSWDWARFEVCGHKWADLSETDYGVSLLTDCKYGYSVHDQVMRVSLLKSAKNPDPEADIGEHDFTYSLYPHTGCVSQGGTIEQAEALNIPPTAVTGGSMYSGKHIAIAGQAAHIDAIKKAEASDALIIRLHECRGGSSVVRLHSDFNIKGWCFCSPLEEEITPISHEAVSFPLHPFQLRTLKIWF